MFKWIGLAKHLTTSMKPGALSRWTTCPPSRNSRRVLGPQRHLFEVRLRRDLTVQSAQWSLLSKPWDTSGFK